MKSCTLSTLIALSVLLLPAFSLHLGPAPTLPPAVPFNLTGSTAPPGCSYLNVTVTDLYSKFEGSPGCTWDCPGGTVVSDQETVILSQGTYNCPAHFLTVREAVQYPNITFIRNDAQAGTAPTSVPPAVYDCTGDSGSIQFDANTIRDPRADNAIPSGTWTCSAEPVPRSTAIVYVDPTDVPRAPEGTGPESPADVPPQMRARQLLPRSTKAL